MKFYINPEAELLGQIGAVVMDESGRLVGCTKLQDIPKGATKAEIDEMKRLALVAVKRFDLIERY